jgi:hypothetical protein
MAYITSLRQYYLAPLWGHVIRDLVVSSFMNLTSDTEARFNLTIDRRRACPKRDNLVPKYASCFLVFGTRRYGSLGALASSRG